MTCWPDSVCAFTLAEELGNVLEAIAIGLAALLAPAFTQATTARRTSHDRLLSNGAPPGAGPWPWPPTPHPQGDVADRLRCACAPHALHRQADARPRPPAD